MINPNIDAVLHLVNGTPNKDVPAPFRMLLQAELLIGIRQFKNCLIWKEFWLKYEGSETGSEGVMEEEERLMKKVLILN